MTTASNIVLTTLNARYMHTAFGLRYLLSNMGDLQNQTQLLEFTIQEQPITIAEQLLTQTPQIIGFSVYIWNVVEITQTIALLKQIAPDIILILGGPEVSHAPDLPAVCDDVDYIISGPGELSFPALCQQILAGTPPAEKMITGVQPKLDELVLPYHAYTDDDIQNRLIYVEASRGCPFKCEFCLSSLDKTATAFPLTPFLAEMEVLLERGVRNFKFIDRTFNLKVATSVSILTFFLDRMTDDLYLHFEVIPDNLPDKLKAILSQFPANHLQFEIGVQTFDPEIQTRINRKQNNDKTKANIKWLREHTGAHLHTDLIFGLPGDTLDNFADSFDQLIALNPQEIQLGILKKLRGAPLNRHNEQFQLRYNPQAPYNILSTSTVTFHTMQRMNRFARFWDMIGNSGRFHHTLPLILGDTPFQSFLQLSDAMYQRTGSSWKIALKRQFELIYLILRDDDKTDSAALQQAIESDAKRCQIKGALVFSDVSVKTKQQTGTANKRQLRHQAAS